jgi:hypothetical protein
MPSMSSSASDVDRLSPEFRRQCLVRFVCVLRAERGLGAAKDFLELYEKKSKDMTLRSESSDQWALGNRGKPMDWRQELAHG